MAHKINKKGNESEGIDAGTFKSIYYSLRYPLTEEEKERAVRYLIDNVPENTLKEVWKEMQNRGPIWSLSYQWGFGGWVRTILRRGGFDWGSITLEDRWAEIVEEAAKRVVESMKKGKT